MISISFPITETDTHHQGSIFRPTVVRFYEVGSIGLKIKKKLKKKKLGLSSLISIHQPNQNFKQIKTYIYLPSCPITWTSLNSNYLASNLLNVQLSIYQVFVKEKSNCPYNNNTSYIKKSCSYMVNEISSTYFINLFMS